MKYLFLLFVVLLYSNVASAAENLYCGSQDCYSVLGIEKGSTAKQIKKAYYKLSVK